MKARFAQWGRVAEQAAKPIPPLHIRTYPGIEDLERKLLLSNGGRGPLTLELDDLLDRISIQLFGVKRQDTESFPPADHHLRPKLWQEAVEQEHEMQYETADLDQDQAAAFLKRFGLDFTAKDGRPLLCTWHLKRQAEAAAKGIMGKMPDRERAKVEGFASRLEADAKAFQNRKR